VLMAGGGRRLTGGSHESVRGSEKGCTGSVCLLDGPRAAGLALALLGWFASDQPGEAFSLFLFCNSFYFLISDLFPNLLQNSFKSIQTSF
jgi:hypothetical protein